MTSLRERSDAPQAQGAPRAQPAPAAAVPALAGPRLVIRAWGSLALANVRYWRTVAPVVERELGRWRARAAAISDPELRTLALAKLDGERFNAEAGAMLATFAPAAQRRSVVEAIVALQVLFDLLDGLTEQASTDPLADGERLFAAFTGALRIDRDPIPPIQTGDYLQELSSTARCALARLPAVGQVIEVAQTSAQRAAEAQIRMHATPLLGIEQMQAWAQQNANETQLQWREFAAGAASSVLSVHALLASAGDPAIGSAEAHATDRAYLSICVLLTLLDSLTDHELDTNAGRQGYASLYDGSELLAQALAATAENAVRQVRELPRAPEHLMILAAVVAYYASAPGARGRVARPHMTQLRHSLQPLISPALAVMWSWRVARRFKASY